jgi:hypothetical protein
MYGTDGGMTHPSEPEEARPPEPEAMRPPVPEEPRPPESEPARPLVSAAAEDAVARALRGAARESTGDERVDAAIARLGELDGAPTAAHPEIFQDVHRRLQEALTGIDGEQP